MQSAFLLDAATPAIRRVGVRSDTLAVLAALAFLTIHALMWTLFAASQYASPPSDNVEQLNWAHSIEWGYYKHPPLPTWLLHASMRTGADGVLLTYALGQLCGAVGLFLTWRACLRLMDRRSALIALLLGSTIYYFSARGHFYNHNTVMLPFVGAAALAFVHAVQRGQLRWFAALGVAVGLGTLVKYQMLLFAGVFLLAFASLGSWRRPGFMAGLLLACTLAAAIVAPHLQWLLANDFSTLAYARGSFGARLPLAPRAMVTLSFLGQQLVRLLPTALALWLALRWSGAAPPDHGRGHGPEHGRAAQTRALVLWLAVAPLSFVLLLGLGFGVRLQNHWGTAILLLMLPAIGWALSRCAIQPRWPAVLGAVLLLQALTAGVLLARMGHAEGRERYSAYPSQRLADAALQVWQIHAGSAAPPVLIGPPWDAGALAARLPGPPMVLTHGLPATAPWVERERVLGCGALVVWPADQVAEESLPWGLAQRITHRSMIEAPLSHGRGTAPVRLALGVVPPRGCDG